MTVSTRLRKDVREEAHGSFHIWECERRPVFAEVSAGSCVTVPLSASVGIIVLAPFLCWLDVVSVLVESLRERLNSALEYLLGCVLLAYILSLHYAGRGHI